LKRVYLYENHFNGDRRNRRNRHNSKSHFLRMMKDCQ
jgi:hypothetical protein